MGQHPQLQPQEDFPFFLFLIMQMTTASTIAISTRLIIIVAILSEIHPSIRNDSFPIQAYFTFTFEVSLVASL